MVNEILNATFQILTFTLVPFVVYLIRESRVRGFFNYIGLKRSTSRGNLSAVLVSVVLMIPSLGLIMISDDFRQIMLEPDTMTGKFREMGLSGESVVILLVAAIFKTSFAEEILFRGFVAKRLISVMGYFRGNLTQALIFGALHLLLFLTITKSIFFLVFMLVFASLGAYLSAYLNEKLAHGSIIPGWIAHGLANVVSYSIIGFVI